jgi:hypothetical protein
MLIVAPVRLLTILLPIVDWLEAVEVVDVEEVVDGVEVLVVAAVAVGTLLLLTLDTIVMTSSGP